MTTSRGVDKRLVSGSTDTDLIRENKRLRCDLAHITAQRNRFEKLLTERKEKRKR